MNDIIDLRSDTVTRPSKEMLAYMMDANVGDDVLGDDPEVQKLESMMAKMFGHEAAIFCPSGTMTNQIAVNVHTVPGNEVICDITSHVYNFEAGGIAFNSGCSVKLVHGDSGRMKPGQVFDCINPDNVHYPATKLVVVENTSNMGGGSIYDYSDLVRIGEICRQNSLKYHLDGARLFNALVETGEKPLQYGKLFDSISICFSKGLGAPVGSVLIGNQDFITNSRRIRKVFGGGMRQTGYLAAAAIYAMNNNIGKLKEDHRRAREIAARIGTMSYVAEVMKVHTNIIIFRLNDKYKQDIFLDLLNKKGMLAIGFGPDKIRLVTHLDFTDEMLDKSFRIFKDLD